MPDTKKNALTPKQFAVSQISDHHAYVIALPGSGKTHTSVELTINLLNADDSNMMLIVTFTRAAAKEISERLARRLSEEQIKRIKVATLDSCVVNMAKQIFKQSNSQFKLLLGSKYYLTIFRITKELAIPEHDTVAEVLNYYLSTPVQPNYECELHQSIVELYQSILSSMYFPTYDLKSLAKMVINKMTSGEVLPYKFSHCIVDEFQDTGGVQYEWIKQHALLGGTKIIGVGDDDQSIYRFAGGLGYSNFLNLKHDLGARAYALDTCFRCAPKILEFAKSVITHNTDRVDKEFNSIDKGIQGDITIYHHSLIVDDLLPHFEKHPKNTAVLCRTNQLLTDIEVLFINNDIPYQRISGKNTLLNDPNVHAYITLLAIIVLNRHITELPNILGWLGESEEILSNLSYLIKRQKIKTFQAIDWSQIGGYSTCTNEIISNFQKWSTPVSGNDPFLRQKNIVVGLQDFMPSNLATKKVFAAVDFINNKMKGDTLAEKVKRVLSIMSSVSDDSVVIDRNVVTLSTLHGSKGLEFQTVWIPDASDQKIPSKLKESSIEAQNDELKHIEDERRLFYVGITRAEQTLNISFNNVMGQFLANADMTLCQVFDKNGELIEANS